MKEDKNMEIFLLSQFIDVIDVLEKIDNIEEIKIDLMIRKRLFEEYMNKISTNRDLSGLDLFNDKIDEKLKDNKYIYRKNESYKKVIKGIKFINKNLTSKLDDVSKKQLCELRSLIIEMKNFDVHLAYKIGIVDGMKIKTTCIKL